MLGYADLLVKFFLSVHEYCDFFKKYRFDKTLLYRQFPPHFIFKIGFIVVIIFTFLYEIESHLVEFHQRSLLHLCILSNRLQVEGGRGTKHTISS